MIKIGITGNIGSGKSIVEDILIKKGFKTLCADRISHDAFENNEIIKKQIYEIFKTNDRHEIGNIIFKDKKKKRELEDILHPVIKKIIEAEFKNSNEDKIFVFVPLLFEAKYEDIFDKIILVSANEKLRLQRIIKRNNYEKEHALNRIKSQMSEDKKIDKCDFILKNEGSFQDLEKNLEKILGKI